MNDRVHTVPGTTSRRSGADWSTVLWTLLATVCVSSGLLPPATASAAPPLLATPEYSIPWLMEPRVRDYEEDIDFLQLRLKSLAPYSTQAISHAGFHSRPRGVANDVQWVQVDLGREFQIDSIALVPAAVQFENTLVEGYAFPVRFRVQVARSADFREATLMADFTTADYTNPGRFPVHIRGLSQSGRFVRITVTRSPDTGGRYFFALGELIVLSGMRNVAAWRPVTTSDPEYTIENRWSREYLVDQNSMLPLPIGPVASHTEGFVSAPQRGGNGAKWIQLDLGTSLPIDEIRIVPARPRGQTDLPGWGFPERFRVELANEPDLRDAQVFCDFSNADIQHWTDRAMILPGELREFLATSRGGFSWTESPAGFPSEPVSARYIRLTATQLDSRISPARLALSEFQIYSGRNNVATEFDVVVTASDVDTSFEPRRWGPQFLVDDFTSRARLLEFPAWLGQLDNRRDWELDLRFAIDQHRIAVNQVWINLAIAGGVFVVLSITGLTWFNWKQAIEHRIETENLRTQIANDLHDDIGSNLGAIALLSQTTVGHQELPAELKPELEEIRIVALETSDAMRDILWLIRTPTSLLEDFVGRLRTVIARLLSNCETSFVCESDVPAIDVPLSWRRNVFLSYKEVLHNAARHSQAQTVKVRIAFSDDSIEIVVADDGQGFDIEAQREGLGINSIRKRVDQLGGIVQFDSTIGAGTTITIRVPFPGARYRWQRLGRYARSFMSWTHRLRRRARP
ncbi:MAG: ATP-binding protein [Planctomycetota bacterium]|jgi:signal transduction histidine kinase